jgi:gliding motility-associated-like protein
MNHVRYFNELVFGRHRRLCILVTFLMGFGASYAQKLEITGQKSLTTGAGEPITLSLSDFTVKGSGENEYPNDFELEVFDGKNYSVSGRTVTPDKGFTGTLKVTIRISRVKGGRVLAQTKKTDIKIEVKGSSSPPPAGNTPPEIIGQKTLRTTVNQPIKIELSHLTVVDPDDKYPNGFTLKLSGGDNYSISQGNTVVPGTNFSGVLTVPTVVNDGKADSKPFALVITVATSNDPQTPTNGIPVFLSFSPDPIELGAGNNAVPIAREVDIADPDSDELFYAEAFLDPAHVTPGKDELTAEPSGDLRYAYDNTSGVLVIFGKASINRYRDALRTITYTYKSDTLPAGVQKRVHFRLNDGVNFSEIKTKSIIFSEQITLDIPTVFSPNDDRANDFWVISAEGQSDNVRAIIRVFDQRGVLIYESSDLGNYWDGRSNGRTVPSGTYFYVIDIHDGPHRSRRQGAVTVLK